MIDRDAFDRQISSIRTRYNRLCSTSPVAVPSVPSFSSLTENGFTTPLKAGKDTNHSTKMPEVKDPLGEKSSLSARIESEVIMHQTERHLYESTHNRSLTSRKGSSGNDQSRGVLSEKQQLLLRRVEDNEKRLKVSFQLRKGEASASQTHLRKEQSLQEDIASYRRKKGASSTHRDVTFKENRENRENGQSQGMAGRKQVTHKEGRPFQRVKENMNDEYTQSKRSSSQKMIQILSNLRSPSPQRISQREQVPVVPAVMDPIEMKLLHSMNPTSNRDALKTGNSQASQRMRALMSYY